MVPGNSLWIPWAARPVAPAEHSAVGMLAAVAVLWWRGPWGWAALPLPRCKGVGRCGKLWKVYKHIMDHHGEHRCEHLLPKTRWWSWLEVFVVLPANLPAIGPVLVAVLISKENIEHEAKQSITLEHDGSQNGCQNGRNLWHNLSNLRFRLRLGRKWPSLALRRFSYFRSSTNVLAGWRK